jgi:Clp amino terminal domain, pathogenicity island component
MGQHWLARAGSVWPAPWAGGQVLLRSTRRQTMFERFTDRGRRVVVLAQEEARMRNHSFIGTEQILLALIDEGVGTGVKALESLGISLDAVRQQVEEIIGQGQHAPSGHIPSTPGPRRCSSFPCASRCSSATTTSAPSTSCSASSVRATAWPASAGQAGRRPEPGASAGHPAHQRPATAAGLLTAQGGRAGGRGTG